MSLRRRPRQFEDQPGSASDHSSVHCVKLTPTKPIRSQGSKPPVSKTMATYPLAENAMNVHSGLEENDQWEQWQNYWNWHRYNYPQSMANSQTDQEQGWDWSGSYYPGPQYSQTSSSNHQISSSSFVGSENQTEPQAQSNSLSQEFSFVCEHKNSLITQPYDNYYHYKCSDCGGSGYYDSLGNLYPEFESSAVEPKQPSVEMSPQTVDNNTEFHVENNNQNSTNIFDGSCSVNENISQSEDNISTCQQNGWSEDWVEDHESRNSHQIVEDRTASNRESEVLTPKTLQIEDLHQESLHLNSVSESMQLNNFQTSNEMLQLDNSAIFESNECLNVCGPSTLGTESIRNDLASSTRSKGRSSVSSDSSADGNVLTEPLSEPCSDISNSNHTSTVDTNEVQNDDIFDHLNSDFQAAINFYSSEVESGPIESSVQREINVSAVSQRESTNNEAEQGSDQVTYPDLQDIQYFKTGTSWGDNFASDDDEQCSREAENLQLSLAEIECTAAAAEKEDIMSTDTNVANSHVDEESNSNGNGELLDDPEKHDPTSSIVLNRLERGNLTQATADLDFETVPEISALPENDQETIATIDSDGLQDHNVISLYSDCLAQGKTVSQVYSERYYYQWQMYQMQSENTPVNQTLDENLDSKQQTTLSANTVEFSSENLDDFVSNNLTNNLAPSDNIAQEFVDYVGFEHPSNKIAFEQASQEERIEKNFENNEGKNMNQIENGPEFETLQNDGDLHVEDDSDLQLDGCHKLESNRPCESETTVNVFGADLENPVKNMDIDRDSLNLEEQTDQICEDHELIIHTAEATEIADSSTESVNVTGELQLCQPDWSNHTSDFTFSTSTANDHPETLVGADANVDKSFEVFTYSGNGAFEDTISVNFESQWPEQNNTWSDSKAILQDEESTCADETFGRSPSDLNVGEDPQHSSFWNSWSEPNSQFWDSWGNECEKLKANGLTSQTINEEFGCSNGPTDEDIEPETINKSTKPKHPAETSDWKCPDDWSEDNSATQVPTWESNANQFQSTSDSSSTAEEDENFAFNEKFSSTNEREDDEGFDIQIGSVNFTNEPSEIPAEKEWENFDLGLSQSFKDKESRASPKLLNGALQELLTEKGELIPETENISKEPMVEVTGVAAGWDDWSDQSSFGENFEKSEQNAHGDDLFNASEMVIENSELNMSTMSAKHEENATKAVDIDQDQVDARCLQNENGGSNWDLDGWDEPLHHIANGGIESESCTSQAEREVVVGETPCQNEGYDSDQNKTPSSHTDLCEPNAPKQSSATPKTANGFLHVSEMSDENTGEETLSSVKHLTHLLPDSTDLNNTSNHNEVRPIDVRDLKISPSFALRKPASKLPKSHLAEEFLTRPEKLSFETDEPVIESHVSGKIGLPILDRRKQFTDEKLETSKSAAKLEKKSLEILPDKAKRFESHQKFQTKSDCLKKNAVAELVSETKNKLPVSREIFGQSSVSKMETSLEDCVKPVAPRSSVTDSTEVPPIVPDNENYERQVLTSSERDVAQSVPSHSNRSNPVLATESFGYTFIKPTETVSARLNNGISRNSSFTEVGSLESAAAPHNLSFPGLYPTSFTPTGTSHGPNLASRVHPFMTPPPGSFQAPLSVQLPMSPSFPPLPYHPMMMNQMQLSYHQWHMHSLYNNYVQMFMQLQAKRREKSGTSRRHRSESLSEMTSDSVKESEDDEEFSDPGEEAEAAVDEAQRYTPELYSSVHSVARFSSNGRFAFTDNINASCSQLFQTPRIIPIPESVAKFPGPFNRDKTMRSDAKSYLQDRLTKATNEGCKELIFLIKYLILLIQGNGAVSGLAISRILLDEEEGDIDDYEWDEFDLDLTDNGFMINDEVEPTKDHHYQMVQHAMLGDEKKLVEYTSEKNLWGFALRFSALCPSHAFYCSVVDKFDKSCILGTSNPLRTFLAMREKRSFSPEMLRNCWKNWEQHVAIVLSNPTNDDDYNQFCFAMLGKALDASGLQIAAQICYVLAGLQFSMPWDPDFRLLLLGTKARTLSAAVNDLDSIFLSLCFEYAVHLRPKAQSVCFPTLQTFKLLVARQLVELGLKEKSFEYCQDIASEVLKNPLNFAVHFVQQLMELSHQLSSSVEDVPTEFIGRLEVLLEPPRGQHLETVPTVSDDFGSQLEVGPSMMSVSLSESQKVHFGYSADSQHNHIEYQNVEANPRNPTEASMADSISMGLQPATFDSPLSSLNWESTMPGKVAVSGVEENRSDNLGSEPGSPNVFADSAADLRYLKVAAADESHLFIQGSEKVGNRSAVAYDMPSSGYLMNTQSTFDPSLTEDDYRQNNYYIPQTPKQKLQPMFSGSINSVNSFGSPMRKSQNFFRESIGSEVSEISTPFDGNTSVGGRSRQNSLMIHQRPQSVSSDKSLKYNTVINEGEEQSVDDNRATPTNKEPVDAKVKPDQKSQGTIFRKSSWLFTGVRTVLGKIKPLPNQMHLPDDRSSDFYWDPELKKWVDKTRDGQEEELPPPPPVAMSAPVAAQQNNTENAATTSEASTSFGSFQFAGPPAAPGNPFARGKRMGRPNYVNIVANFNGVSDTSTQPVVPETLLPNTFPPLMPFMTDAPPFPDPEPEPEEPMSNSTRLTGPVTAASAISAT